MATSLYAAVTVLHRAQLFICKLNGVQENYVFAHNDQQEQYFQQDSWNNANNSITYKYFV